MSRNFVPPGSVAAAEQVEIVANFVNGDAQTWDGQFAADTLAEYRALVAQGWGGWQLIDKLLGDDWGAPPRGVQFFVNGDLVASIYYEKPKRSRR
jgi:hypothetical protein